jgi:hypothetical protein
MNHIRVTVLLVERFEKPKEWKLELPPMPPEEAADLVFEISNAPPEFLTQEKRALLSIFPRTGMRSVSKGDMLIIQDHENPDHRHFLTVEGTGFKYH